MTLKLIIGNKNYSSWSLRPWIAMKVAGIAFDEVLLPLYEPGSREQVLGQRANSFGESGPVLFGSSANDGGEAPCVCSRTQPG